MDPLLGYTDQRAGNLDSPVIPTRQLPSLLLSKKKQKQPKLILDCDQNPVINV
jgi:hypothetical protein